MRPPPSRTTITLTPLSGNGWVRGWGGGGSSGKFRVIGALTQFPPFARAFHCPVGAPMAPPKTQVCRLW